MSTGSSQEYTSTSSSNEEKDEKHQAHIAHPESVLSSDSSTARHRTSDYNQDDQHFIFPGPPPLNYTIHINRRERYIIIFFVLLFVESGVLPLILFYALRWGAHLSITTNLAIITSLIGTVSGLKIAQRTYDLWFRTGHESRRPIGAGRYGVDAFHILINIGLGAFFVPLIIGSSLTPANVSTVAMALPCFMLTFCIPLFITGIWDRHLRLPFRVSSLPPRGLLPPLTYTITEDIVAVDGGGGLAFRQAWRHRYEASRVMRRLCRVTAVVWGLSGCVVAIALLAAAWTAPTDTAYGLGYGIPWLWAVIASAWTVWYVKRSLKKEYEEWDNTKVHKEVELHLVEKDIDREVDRLQRMRSIASAVESIGPVELERIAREGRERRRIQGYVRDDGGNRSPTEIPLPRASDEAGPPQTPTRTSRPRVSIEESREKRHSGLGNRPIASPTRSKSASVSVERAQASRRHSSNVQPV